VNGCATHGPLIGGYVLGALEPHEMEEMRTHVAVCPQCGPEVDRLAALPGMLDRIVPADVPPPALSPQVEEAVLDRFARERREEAAEPARPSQPRFGVRLGRRPSAGSGGPAAIRRGPLAVAAAGLVALVVGLTLLQPGDEGGAYASAALDPMAGGSGSATAQIGQVPAGTGIRLQARGLPAGEYEVWCIRSDGRWVSGGTFWPESNGEAQAYMTAAVRAGDYHRIVVTRNPDRGGERGPAVLAGQLQY
jgi:Anti-sigma-K factor rskA/Putative zinc-finger